MITEIDVTQFDILSPLTENQKEYIACLQRKRPRVGKTFPTFITVSEDIGIKGTAVYKDPTFYINSESYKQLPELWKTNEWKTTRYLFDYSSEPFDSDWDDFCAQLCQQIFNDIVDRVGLTPQVDFAKKLCRRFVCNNGISRFAISEKGYHLCRHSDKTIAGDITEVAKQIEQAKNASESFCQSCVCFHHCNAKCGIAKKDFSVCEAKQTLFSQFYELEERIFETLSCRYTIKDVSLKDDNRYFFTLRELNTGLISKLVDRDDAIACLKLSSEDLDTMLSNDIRQYSDLSVINHLELWIECSEECVEKCMRVFEKYRYRLPYNFYPKTLEDFEIVSYYMQKQILPSLFEKEESANIWEYWRDRAVSC